MTILDAIIQSLGRACEYNRDDQLAPAATLRQRCLPSLGGDVKFSL
jgi:hypothetical protein